MLYSLVAMKVEQIKTVKKLCARLQTDPVFRYTCGFSVLSEPPSPATFSRFINKLSMCGLLENEFKSLIIRATNCGIVDGTNVAIDSTAIHAYEKAVPKSKLEQNNTNSSDWGVKKVAMVR